MATSTCGKCGNTSFEMKLVEPEGSNYKMQFIQCSSCGVPVGVTEYYNIGALVEKLQQKVESTENSVITVNSNLRTLFQNLQNWFSK